MYSMLIISEETPEARIHRRNEIAAFEKAALDYRQSREALYTHRS